MTTLSPSPYNTGYNTACKVQMFKGTMLNESLSVPKQGSYAQTSVAVPMMMMNVQFLNLVS